MGVKIGWGSVCLRGLFDITVNGSAKAVGVDAGVTVEYYLLPGPVSPYIGASVGGGYMTQSNVSTVETFSAGALAGVEIYIFDFLSVFAEYSIQADLTNTTDIPSSTSTFDYLINTGMGNNAKLGVVIYFMRSGTKSK